MTWSRKERNFRTAVRKNSKMTGALDYVLFYRLLTMVVSPPLHRYMSSGHSSPVFFPANPCVFVRAPATGR